MSLKIRTIIAFVFILFFIKIMDIRYLKTQESMNRIELTNCTLKNSHSICFMNKLFCHPGYSGRSCSNKQIPPNPWYTDDCPNLKELITFNIDMPIEMISKGEKCKSKAIRNGLTECAYLCFSHPDVGVAQIPVALWKIFQQNEASVWKGSTNRNDRGKEHLEGFDQYNSVPSNLGNFIEVGSGPFTQTQYLISRNFEKISLLDPGANNYIKTHLVVCTKITVY